MAGRIKKALKKLNNAGPVLFRITRKSKSPTSNNGSSRGKKKSRKKK